MQYIFFSLVYFENGGTRSWGRVIHFSCVKGVGPSKKGILLPYLQRKYCKEVLCIITKVVVFEEVGFQALENSLRVRDLLLKR
jgi:hypothetical protein